MINSINLSREIGPEIVLPPVRVELNLELELSEGCVLVCAPSDRYSCPSDYFSVDNLFSEVTDDYQRAVIRQNLGISTDSGAVWGKIGGNLANQKDLYNFIKEAIQNTLGDLLENLSYELKYFTSQIENKIESLASNIKSIEVIPRYATTSLLPVDILVTWEYDNPVLEQAINNIAIDPEARDYIFLEITDDFTVRLSYKYNDVWLSRNVDFDVVFPTFYGTSLDPTEDNYSIKDIVTVNAQDGLYIYVFTKNESDLSVNGLIGGFEDLGHVVIDSVLYNAYKSVNPGLGKTTIRIHDRE